MIKYYIVGSLFLVSIFTFACSEIAIDDQIKAHEIGKKSSELTCLDAVNALIKKSNYSERIYDGVQISYELQATDIMLIALRSPKNHESRINSDKWLITWLTLNLKTMSLNDVTNDDLNPTKVLIEDTFDTNILKSCGN